jgi:hypothetical protein
MKAKVVERASFAATGSGRNSGSSEMFSKSYLEQEPWYTEPQTKSLLFSLSTTNTLLKLLVTS